MGAHFFRFNTMLSGVLLIDKPKGPSSFDIIRKIRKLSGIKRIGHAGTLDPEASGVLVVCLGAYTKLAGYLTESSKIYEAVIELGIQTSTDDQEGEIISEKTCEHLGLQDIIRACEKFIGKINQIPPRYSALKLNGQRAYNLARAQKDFVLSSREIEIFSLEILALEIPHIHIRVHCSKGTYIRALARDIGDHLEVGAHARDIRRITSGSFTITSALALESLTPENLADFCLKDQEALGGLNNFNISASEYEHIKHGRSINREDISSDIAIALFDNKAVAIMQKRENYLKVLRLI